MELHVCVCLDDSLFSIYHIKKERIKMRIDFLFIKLNCQYHMT